MNFGVFYRCKFVENRIGNAPEKRIHFLAEVGQFNTICAGLLTPVKTLPLLKPYPDREMEVYPVGLAVNKPENNGPGLIERVAS